MRACRYQSVEHAQQLLAAGQPEAVVEAAVPVQQSFSARTYLDKYGPEGRYDILAHAPNAQLPALVA
jgi:hypothetical protein